MSKKTSHNFSVIKNSKRCCCTYCLRIFSVNEVVDWTDDEPEQTALCPHCGLDFVLGDYNNDIEQIVRKAKYDKEKNNR